MAKKQSTPAATSSASNRWHAVAAAIAIVVATVAAYYPALGGGFIYDDTALLVYNPVIHASDGLWRIWFTTAAIDYWPVFNSALWLQWRLWGMNPAGYHAVNVGLHVVSALLSWLLLRRLAIPGAWLAALWFALHPANVESVAWIAQLKNLLALLFLLLATLAFLESQQGATSDSHGGKRRATCLCLSVLMFLLAMLSKGSVAFFPLLLVLILWWLRKLSWRELPSLIPFVAVTVVLVPVNAWFRARFDVEAAANDTLERFLGAGAALWFYVYTALLPVNLSFLYPKWTIEPSSPAWWAPVIAVIGVTLVLWSYRATWSRAAWFAWSAFVIALAPVLAIAGAAWMRQFSVADHYLHIPLVAAMAAVGAAWDHWHSRLPGARSVTYGAAMIVTTAFAVATWRQGALYVDAITLYEASLRSSPGSALAHHNLGLALVEAQRPAAALEHFDEALRLRPNYAEAHYSTGLALTRMDRREEALRSFERAVSAAPGDTLYRQQLAHTYAAAGQLATAVEQWNEVIRLHPENAEAHNDLGNALLQLGRLDEAVARLHQALALAPTFAAAHHNLGRALLATGESKRASVPLREAVRLNPSSVAMRNDLAVALAGAGLRDEAIAQLRQALRLDPEDRDVRANLEELEALPPAVTDGSE